MSRDALVDMTDARWQTLLQRVFARVSDDRRCRAILADIGRIRFQLHLSDRPDLDYWEDYRGDRVEPHLGVVPDWTVLAATTFDVFTGTLLGRISLMEAAADELYQLHGDTGALMRCANLLPFVMASFADAVSATQPPSSGDRS